MHARGTRAMLPVGSRVALILIFECRDKIADLISALSVSAKTLDVTRSPASVRTSTLEQP